MFGNVPGSVIKFISSHRGDDGNAVKWARTGARLVDPAQKDVCCVEYDRTKYPFNSSQAPEVISELETKFLSSSHEGESSEASEGARRATGDASEARVH